MNDDQFFLVGQKAFIRNEKGQLLLLNDPDRGLDLPGGKIQEGESDFDEALRREVREETNLEIEIGEPFIRWYHEGTKGSEHAGKPFFLIGFHCKYLSGELKLSHEHDRYAWVDKTNYDVFEGLPGYKNAVNACFASDD